MQQVTRIAQKLLMIFLMSCSSKPVNTHLLYISDYREGRIFSKADSVKTSEERFNEFVCIKAEDLWDLLN